MPTRKPTTRHDRDEPVLKRVKVKVKDLRPNPFRRLDRYPIDRDKIEALKESIGSTGFWRNIVGRPGAGDTVQIVFGHHRLVAIQELYQPSNEVEIEVRDLSPDDMIRMMARENRREWGASIWRYVEAVESAIAAYDRGEITLPDVGARGPRRETCQGSGKFFNTRTVAEFLGYTRKADKGSVRPNRECEIAFRVIDLMERGLLDAETLGQLRTATVEEIVHLMERVRQSHLDHGDREARMAQDKRDLAVQQTHPAVTALLEEEAAMHERQAAQAQANAVNQPVLFAERAAALYEGGRREPGRGSVNREVRQMAEEYVAPRRRPDVKHPDKFYEKLSRKLEDWAQPGSVLAKDVDFAVQIRDDATRTALELVNQSFDSVMAYLRELKARLNAEPARPTARAQAARPRSRGATPRALPGPDG
jgi:hypothetical protein